MVHNKHTREVELRQAREIAQCAGYLTRELAVRKEQGRERSQITKRTRNRARESILLEVHLDQVGEVSEARRQRSR